MRNRDGLKLLDTTSFTADVEGQLARRKLRLGDSESFVRTLLPAIEQGMADNAITFEHSGLNGIASGQLAVVRIGNLLYRMSIYTSTRDPNTAVKLSLDSMWCGIDGAQGYTDGRLGLTPQTTAHDISAMMAQFVQDAQK